MSEMPKEMTEHYLNEANKHADFLCSKVFKPAFVMAFVHGAKHAREDLEKELEMSQHHFNIEDVIVKLKGESNG